MRRNRKNHRHWLSAVLIAVAVLAWSARVTLPSVAGNSATTVATGLTQAACVIRANDGQPAANNDPLARFLMASAACPTNVFEFRAQLAAAGAKLRPTLVANRGFHNQKTQSGAMHFMMFEIVSGRLGALGLDINDGEFFFGHFTATNGTTLAADQRPARASLMVELIAWDETKEVFNFYELIGDGQRGQWFYRGDSVDVQHDVRLLHRQPNSNNPQFGARLRCSGCHLAGGPIMKELAAPHNDWRTDNRPLPFGSLQPNAQLTPILKGLADAGELAVSVRAGLSKLVSSAKFQQANKALALPERLRPLFCPVELNLESDLLPLDERAAQVSIPAAFFTDPWLAQGRVLVKRAHYTAALAALRAAFPEAAPRRADADHGWLTPVKAFSDTLVIESLIKDGLIDHEFATDVLAVDLTNPLFSPARCGLLRLVPEKADAAWQKTFKEALKAAAPNNPGAQELFDNLTNPARDAKFHQARAARFLEQCRQRLQTLPAVTELVRLLAQRRAEVSASEISKNRRGQILEPGFRVIFPTSEPIAPRSLRLTEDGLVIRQ